MSSDIVADLFRSLCKIVDVTTARFLKTSSGEAGFKVVDAYYSQKCIERNKSLPSKRSLFVNLPTVVSGAVSEVSGIPTYSKSRSVYAIIHSVAPAKKSGAKESPESQEFIEIWNAADGGKLLSAVDPKPQKIHGKIHTDEIFGVLAWSHGEGHLAYLAERKVERKSFFESAAVDDENEDLRGTQFHFRETWGEQLTEVIDPVVCLADIASGIVNLPDVPLPDSQSPQLVRWYPGDEALLIVAIENEPAKFGRIYCPIRRTVMYRYDIETGTLTRTGASLDDQRAVAVTSASFSPDGKILAWLENNSGGPHVRGSRLVLQPVAGDPPTSKPVTVMDTVARGMKGDFPGLYGACLHDRFWSSNSEHILVNTIWNSQTAIIAVHLTTNPGSVSRLSSDDACWLLLDVDGDKLIAKRSTPNSPDCLHYGTIAPDFKSVEWTPIGARQDCEEISSFIDWTSFWVDGQPHVDLMRDLKHLRPYEVDAHDFEGLSYECIFVHPRDDAERWPLVVFPHGGPHSASTTAYRCDTVHLVQCGYAVLFVNYRGSCGYGEDSLCSLPGNVGRQDVDDVHNAVLHALKRFRNIDEGSIVALGGSHGGFLTLHLVGQFPDFYKAAVAHNPVIDLVAMAGFTDIRDWAIVEGLGILSDRSEEMAIEPLSGEVLEILRSKSPVAHVDKVKCPVMIVLGANDKRVPAEHGLSYVRRLKQNHILHKVLWYPENCHPIEKLDAKADEMINTAKWLNMILGRD